MAYQTWHDYGYGVNISNLKTDAGKIRGLLNLAPRVKQNILDAIDENKDIMTGDSFGTLTLEDFETAASSAYDDAYPIANITTEAISEAADIAVSFVSDYNGSQFIIVPLVHPWELTETMKNWKSEDDIRDVFEKYFDVITDQSLEELDFCYQEIENGG